MYEELLVEIRELLRNLLHGPPTHFTKAHHVPSHHQKNIKKVLDLPKRDLISY
jgi:hypothetical protein